MQQITDGATYTSQYQYNFAGALVQETYPSGRVVRNEFESDGDLSRIWGTKDANAPERTYANSFSYTADGKIERLKLGNNRWEWAKFNERLQVTELNLGAGVTDASLWKLTYHYGELNSDGRTVDTAKNTGNIAMQTVSFAGLTEPFVQTYRYDSLYRITEARETNGATTNAAQNWKETFGYDRFGNRTDYAKFTGTTQLTLDNKTFPTINPNTNRFDPNQGYLYDKNGNLISDAEGRSFVFNGENKQSKIIKDGKLVGEYDYNGEGQRVRKRTYDANGALQDTTVFVYSAGKLVAEYSTAAPENPTTRYTATDMLGSPRVLTDSEGNVIARRDFKPFGEEITDNAGERNVAAKYGVADNLKQKFTTYQRDDESGLDFAEARMYENRHGRFTAVDPLLASGKSANPQTFNRFVYVLNNPLILSDPEGLQAGTWVGNPNKRNENGKWSAQFVAEGGSVPDGSTPLTNGYDQRTNMGLIGRIGDTYEILHPNQNMRAQTNDLRLAERQLAQWNNGGGLIRADNLTVMAGTVAVVGQADGPLPVVELLTVNVLIATMTLRAPIPMPGEAGDRIPRVGPIPLPLPEPSPSPSSSPSIPVPVPQPSSTPETPNYVTVYRGLNGTNPGAFRFDGDGLSTFEVPSTIHRFNMPFTVQFTGQRVPGVTGTVVSPLFTTPVTATFTPQFGPGHWSINFPGVPVTTAQQELSARAKQMFGGQR